MERAGTAINPLTYASPVYPMNAQMLDELAGLTGGRSFYSEEIHAVLSQLDADAGSGYLAAYEPASDNWDQKFHKIKVSLERKSTKVRGRNRYFALPDNRPANVRQQVALAGGFISQTDVPDIGLRVKTTPGAQQVMHLSIRIDPADLLLREAGGGVEGQMAIMFAAYGAAGPKGSTTPQNFNLKLTADQRAKAAKDGLPFEQDFPGDPSITKLRFIVADLLTGAVGTVTVPTTK